jgi:hypothetical protein|tara:strand:- start:33 stop:425 length:393 start_codon:yes stop_codon:yes gene_type:complete
MVKKKKQKYPSFIEKGIRYLQCKECGDYQPVSSKSIIATLCSKCLNKKIPNEPSKAQYVPTGRPAGWHWMKEFVDVDGNVFHKGKEQPKLKGSLPPSKIKSKKKRKKRRTKNEVLIALYNKKKKALKNKK